MLLPEISNAIRKRYMVLKKLEKSIFRRTERAVCGGKVVDRKTIEEQIDMLGLHTHMG